MDDAGPVPVTGDPGVDAVTAAVARLAAGGTEPLEAHVTAYEQASRALQERLADGED